jgi:hypothetical protein
VDKIVKEDVGTIIEIMKCGKVLSSCDTFQKFRDVFPREVPLVRLTMIQMIKILVFGVYRIEMCPAF